MAVTIQINVDTQEYGPNARRVYYDETKDWWWVVYVDDGDVFLEYSNDGLTWSYFRYQLNTDAGATCDRPTLCSDGTYLYVFWVDDGSGDDGIHFRRLTLSNNTLYPAIADGLVVDLGSLTSIHQISAVCTASSGDVWVSIPEEGEGPWYSDDNGASWNDSSDADIGASDMFTTLIELTGDKLMCIYDAGGTADNDIRWKIYDAGWGTEATLVDDIWTDSSDPSAAYRCNAVHIGSDEVIWAAVEPVLGLVSSDIAVFHFDGTDTWTQRADYDTDNYYSWVIPAYDKTSSKLYLYFDSFISGKINRPAYDTSIDKGINWAGEVVIESENVVASSVSINSNSLEMLGVTWLLLTTLYFEEIADLSVAAGPNVNGVANADIAKIDGVAAADIAKIHGVTF